MQPVSSESPAWPTTQWDLAAPESYVLLHGVERRDTQPFKLAIMELVARRALKLIELEQSGLFGIRSRVNLLAEGPEPKLATERSLAAVQRLFGEARLDTFSDGSIGVKVEDFARVAQRYYSPLTDFVMVEVLPTLMERGYYTYEKRKFLGIFPTGRYVLTPSGQAARAELLRRVELGEASLPGWVENDPNRALLYVALAGSSLFLMPMVFGDIAELRHHQGDTAYASALGDAGGGVIPESQLPDLGALDLGAFEGLDSALGAIDAGIDSGTGGGDSGWGGDGGGDGGGFGGGDGGGGGGD